MRGPAWEEPTQSRMKVFHKIQAHFPAVTEEAAGGTGKGYLKNGSVLIDSKEEIRLLHCMKSFPT